MSGRPSLDAWLEAGAGSGERAREVHETPIAKVFVFGDRALKLKKAVDFGYLDFSTQEKRAWAIRRELEFNRRTAPDVYRAVHAVVEEAGTLAFADPDQAGGDALELVLEMRPFATDHILANHPDRVDGDLAERLGRAVARAQAGAPVVTERGGAAGTDYERRSIAEQLRTLAAEIGGAEVERAVAGMQAAFEVHASRLDARRAAGFVRSCHADLHLGNIVVEDARPILFDCIEFNDTLSEIDVGYDIAFLLMDLHFRGRPEAANRVLNAWLDEAGRTFGPDRYAVLAALPLFQSMRAAVRAHVSGHGGELDRARRYLEASQAHLQRPPGRLVAVGGLSGSGKSTWARRIAPRLGAPPGAVVLRSDEVRKRLAGVEPGKRLPPSSYTPEASAQVYAVLVEEGRAVLQAGSCLVLDAAFLRPEERGRAEALAAEMAVPFTGCWMEADEAVLRERLRTRTGDASDADEAVLERQMAADVGEVGWRRVHGEAAGLTV